MTGNRVPSENVPSAPPRVCLLSQRKLRQHAAWGAMYDFEDVICEVDNVNRIDLEGGPTFGWTERIVDSLVWRRWSRIFTRLNPGVEPVSLIEDYDLCVFVCMNPWELLRLNAVQGWKTRCRKKICYMFEVWAGIASRYTNLLELLSQFDYVFLGLESSREAVQSIVDASCHYLAPAVDTLRFSPYPEPPFQSG